MIDVLSAALRKNPRDRYQDAGALARDLRRVLDGREPSPPRVPLSRRIIPAARRHGRATLVAGALAVLVWVGAELIGRPPGETRVERDLDTQVAREQLYVSELALAQAEVSLLALVYELQRLVGAAPWQ